MCLHRHAHAREKQAIGCFYTSFYPKNRLENDTKTSKWLFCVIFAIL